MSTTRSTRSTRSTHTTCRTCCGVGAFAFFTALAAFTDNLRLPPDPDLDDDECEFDPDPSFDPFDPFDPLACARRRWLYFTTCEWKLSSRVARVADFLLLSAGFLASMLVDE